MKRWTLLVLTMVPLGLLSCRTEYSFKSTETILEEKRARRFDRTAFSCDPEADPVPDRMKRLSKIELTNTLWDLSRRYFPAATSEAIFSALEDSLDSLPSDEAEPFERFDQRMSQRHVTALYGVMSRFAGLLTSSASRLSTLAGSCATDGDAGNDDECVRGFLESFGRLVFRRPLSADEMEFFVEQVDRPGSPTRYEELASVLLLSPQFIYRMETGNPANGGSPDHFPLTAYEIASRLSYHFWRTMPDEELMDAAVSGALLGEAEYRRQVARLSRDLRASSAVESFFEQWIGIDETPDVYTSRGGDGTYRRFVGEVPFTADLHRNMIRESRDLVHYVVFRSEGDVSDLLLSDVSFAKTDDMTGIYDVPEWNGGYEPEDLVRFPAGERQGILTRAAFLTSGAVRTRPIIKGVRIRRRVLCDTLPEPPADTGTPPELSEGWSTRRRVAALTEQPGTSCAGCHGKINSLGYASENYDALGRFRTKEKLFWEDGGTGIAQIDTSSDPGIYADDDFHVHDALELNRAIVESGKVQSCMARYYFRYTHRRMEDVNRDGCSLKSLRERAVGGSLREFLADGALSPRFRIRIR